ncbi:hypothetical protein MPSEU_000034700 [Mayamaea pseudoterrestris]|nr:hypothetical protein MPSEU_000034700 [Mayamaea pseudoterrestris]
MASQTPQSSSLPDASPARNWALKLTQNVQLGLQEMTARKYTLPDKNVASQLLMYRQLLHTKCRPGLKLSRDYQGTPAQVAVQHMPWWSEGCQETRKMVISYDNLIQRLWIHGCPNQNHSLDEEPPIPHDDWVHALGFQQTDPVTDFRSGGVLSLAMMVYLCESCHVVYSRFIRPTGDASVLPFAITSINVTDMLSRFLMLSKAVDRMDALLSQKTFWRMFADPNALLACQELSMDLLADVVVELQAERAASDGSPVTVFDFTAILETTEHRVQYDLLGAGPKSVDSLRKIYAKIKTKYAHELQVRLGNVPASATPLAKSLPIDHHAVLQKANQVAHGAQEMAGNMFQRLKQQAPNLMNTFQETNSHAQQQPQPMQAHVESHTLDAMNIASTNPSTDQDSNDVKHADKTSSPSGSDSDWTGTEIQAATAGINNFSIGGEDDEEEDDFL